MKIIYIVYAKMPNERAHGIQIMKTCEAFAGAGVDLTLVLPKIKNNIKQDSFDYYELKRNFRIKRLYVPDLGFLGKYSFRVQVFCFAIFSLFYTILFEKGKVVVYSRGETLLFTYKLFPKRFSLFYETHMKPEKRLNWHLKMMKSASGVITITNFYKDELIRDFFLSKEKVFCAPDGVDEKIFNTDISKNEARKRLSLPDGNIALYCGSLLAYDYKGVDVFLESANFLKNHLCILIGGNAEDIEKLRSLYKYKNIIFLGYKKPNLISLYLKAADTLVIPNKKGNKVSELYTSPMKLFEYMASQRPIVASKIQSILEILNENNAVLFEPNNPRSLAESIIKVTEDKSFADFISLNARNDVLRKYTWGKRAENLLQFIRVSVK